MKMTNDEMLSQDEIDALLKVSSEEDADDINDLSSLEEDTLGEIGNISFGSSATTLSMLLDQKVDITTPHVSIVQKKEVEQELAFEPVSILVHYTKGLIGKNVFIMKSADAAVISDILLGGDGKSPVQELSDMHLGAIQEAMNQMMGTAATSMSTVFNKKVDITPPSITNKENAASFFEEEEDYVKVSFQIRVGNLIDSRIMQLIPFDFAKELVDQVLDQGKRDETHIKMEQAEKQNEPDTQREQPVEENSTARQYMGNSMDQNNATIQEATFSAFNHVELNKTKQRNLDMLLDIPLKVTVELGRTNRSIKDILDLAPGSIVELDKLAGEPVDILVNEKLVARGEVVVIDENFGVRVSDVISQTDRLMKLK